MAQIIGAIDIGTNSLHLMVAEVHDDGSFRTLTREKETIRLGSGGGDMHFHFGGVGDVPAVGDWNGDAAGNIGIFRNGTWLLDVNGNYVWDGVGGSGIELSVVASYRGDVDDDFPATVGDPSSAVSNQVGDDISRVEGWITVDAGHESLRQRLVHRAVEAVFASRDVEDHLEDSDATPRRIQRHRSRRHGLPEEWSRHESERHARGNVELAAVWGDRSDWFNRRHG